MRIGFSITLICFVGFSSAQNLIPNPSFENIEPCDLTPFPGHISMVEDWEVPLCANPAGSTIYYFNECLDTITPVLSVPQSSVGYEYAYDGQGYFGLQLGLSGSGNGDYMSVELLQPLSAGVEYCFSFFISLADSCSYGYQTMDALLTTGPPSICNLEDTSWYQTRQLDVDVSDMEKIGWSEGTASFVAIGGEDHLVIGKFPHSNITDTVYYGGPHAFLIFPFIDMISLTPCVIGVNEHSSSVDLLIQPSLLEQGQLVQVKLSRGTLLQSVTVRDCRGKLVPVNSQVENFGLSVGTSQLTRGFYIITAELKDGKVLSSKFVIQ